MACRSFLKLGISGMIISVLQFSAPVYLLIMFLPLKLNFSRTDEGSIDSLSVQMKHLSLFIFE